MKSLMTIFPLFFGLMAASYAEDIVTFHIPAGTEKQSWNTLETKVMVTVGQTLRIYNDDFINHRLHTNGAPCPHGEVIAPSTYWDCQISKPYREDKNGVLYDHAFGPSARFYLEAAPQNQ